MKCDLANPNQRDHGRGLSDRRLTCLGIGLFWGVSVLGGGGCASVLTGPAFLSGIGGAHRGTEEGGPTGAAAGPEIVLVDRTGQGLSEAGPVAPAAGVMTARPESAASLAAGGGDGVRPGDAVDESSKSPIDQEATRQLAAQLLREMAEMTGDPAIMEQWTRGRGPSSNSGRSPQAERLAAERTTDSVRRVAGDSQRDTRPLGDSRPMGEAQSQASPGDPAGLENRAEDRATGFTSAGRLRPPVESAAIDHDSMRQRPLPNQQQLRVEVWDESMDDEPDPHVADVATRQAMVQAMQQVTQQGMGRLAGAGRSSSGSPALANLLVEQVQNSMTTAQMDQTMRRWEDGVTESTIPAFDLRGNRPLDSRRSKDVRQVSEMIESAGGDPAAPGSRASLDWRTDIVQTIATLERAIGEARQPQERESLEVYLRLLRLIASDREAAVRSIESLPPPRQEYWREQIYALSQILQVVDAESETTYVNQARQATKALTHLQNAMQSLRAEATLQLRQVQFCQEIRSFGDYDRARSTTVGPGDPMLIYAEVLNYLAKRISNASGESFQASLVPSYTIFNDRQQVVSQKEFAVVRDHCRSLRQDFYLVLQVEVPSLPDGKYHIQVSVEDMEAGKIAVSAPLSFQVRAAR